MSGIFFALALLGGALVAVSLVVTYVRFLIDARRQRELTAFLFASGFVLFVVAGYLGILFGVHPK